MQPIDIHARLRETRRLDIASMTADTEAIDAMALLGNFDRFFIGLANFVGQTPWEWHPEDELLLLLEGRVDVEVLPASGDVQRCTLGVGEILTVPATCWHRQHATTGARLLFITSREGNAVSDDADPRQAAHTHA
jgi:mannose-6-phosphate isomerase-like protein (cupin superfamily)